MADFLGTIDKASLKSFKEYAYGTSISSNTLTLDLSQGSVFLATHNANINTFSISNPVSTNGNAVQACTLLLLYTATPYTATWTNVKWPSATAPTLTSSLSKIDIFTFVTPDGGSTWYGFIGGQNY